MTPAHCRLDNGGKSEWETASFNDSFASNFLITLGNLFHPLNIPDIEIIPPARYPKEKVHCLFNASSFIENVNTTTHAIRYSISA